jgi:PEP-CTERM motif
MSYLNQARLVLLAATTAFRLTAFFIVVVLLTFSTHAGAIPRNWTLSDVTFNDGGTATGSFTFDADTSPPALSTWSISVAGGGITPFTYNPTTLLGVAVPSLLVACGGDPTDPRCIVFNLLTPMTGVGGTVTIDSGNSFEDASGLPPQLRDIASGCFTTTGACVTAVSEPSTLLLLGSGLAGVAAALRLRFRHRV